MQQQLDLIPQERCEPENVMVPLTHLPPDSELPGDDPSREFVESIKVFGVIMPIVTVVQNRRQVVADGRRRIKAARAAGLTEVPVRVYRTGWALADVLSLLANQQRSKNIASDFLAIRQLADAGHTEQQIAQAVGMPVGTIRSRMRLAQLTPVLLAGFLDGQIRASVAESIAKQTPATMAKLELVLEETGTVKAGDVEEARQVQRKASLAAVAPVLFSTPETQAPDKLSAKAEVQVAADVIHLAFDLPSGKWSCAVDQVKLFMLLRREGLVTPTR